MLFLVVTSIGFVARFVAPIGGLIPCRYVGTVPVSKRERIFLKIVIRRLDAQMRGETVGEQAVHAARQRVGPGSRIA